MTTYFAIVPLVTLFCFFAEKSRVVISSPTNQTYFHRKISTRVLLFLSLSTLVITAGCRYFVGTDYGAYFLLYNQYITINWSDFISLDEPMLPFIGKISELFFSSCFAMFLITSVVTIGFALYSIYKETDDFVFVTLLYVFVGCWHGTFNGIRQCLAVSIVFLGRKYITHRKLIKYLLVCFIAFLAHRSALFCVLFYFIYSKKFSTKRLVIVLTATILISLNYETMFGFIGWLNDSEFITNDYATHSVSTLRTMVAICPAVVGIYFAYIKKMDKQQIFYVYMIVINAAIRIATANSAYLYRLGMFPALFLPLGISRLTKLCKPKNYKIFRFCIITLYFLYWLYEITNSKTLSEFEWIFGNI